VNVGRLFRAVEDDLESSPYTMTYGNSCQKLVSKGVISSYFLAYASGHLRSQSSAFQRSNDQPVQYALAQVA